MAERDAKISYTSSYPTAPSNSYYPTFEIDLDNFPEYADLKLGDEIKVPISLCVKAIRVDEHCKRMTFDVEAIDVNAADASLKKLVKKSEGNEADASLAKLTGGY